MRKRLSTATWITKAVLLIAASCMLAFTLGCSKDSSGQEKKENGAETSSDPAAEKQKQLLAKYNSVVKNAKEAADIISFLNENMVQADRNTADVMIRGLNKYYLTDLQKSQDAFLQQQTQDVLIKAEWPITSANMASIPDEKVKQLIASKLSGGYKLVMVEGLIYPIVDYELQQTYSKKLTDDLNAFINIQAAESHQPAAQDGGLVISWDELAARAVEAEHYIKQFPSAPERATVQQLYRNDLSMYIIGLNNTPIFDFDTFKLSDTVKHSYERTQSLYPGTVTAAIVAKFVDVLESTDWKVFDKVNGEQTDIAKVKGFRDSFLTEADSMLP